MPQHGRVNAPADQQHTITVTSFMMCRAFSLDSGYTFVFSHQK